MLENALPTRSRSHELEDESIIKFRAAIPGRWVCREKSRDYGVDLEVEIFAEDRRATGLIFYVQLKATDDLRRERKTTMEVDRIQYLADLELPAVIVRYCSVSGGLFWVWDFDAVNQLGHATTTATITFTDAWSDRAPQEVSRALAIRRRLKERRPNEKFVLAAQYQVPYSAELMASQSVNDLLRNLSFIQTFDDGSRVPLQISLLEDKVVITMGLGSLTVNVDFKSTKTTTQTLAYALAAVFLRAGFTDRAATTANYCLSLVEDEMEIPRGLALYACVALKGEPLKASRLAVHAGLHIQQDEIFLNFTSELITSQSAEKAEIATAIQDFFLPAIGSAATDESRGAIMYSMANVRANNHEYAKAVEAFNKARKLRPKYLSSDYFLKELGGALFEGRRFRCSVIAYRQAVDLSPGPKTTFCLGDALLYSGNLSEASAKLALLSNSDDAILAAQARLKSLLADWFLENAIDISLGDSNALRMYVDATDDVETKFLAVLAAAFAERWNRYLWSWAIQLSVYVSNIPIISDVIVCAQEACGSEAYVMTRERMLPFAATQEDLKPLDEISINARDMVASRPSRPYTARLLDGDQTIVFERKM
jgi:tetratricopeptide (TPR) repeat protein